MSGKKTSFISLSQEQYQTLHNAFIKNLFFGGNRDNAQTRNDQELQNRVDYDRDQILNREKEFTDLAFGLSRQIQDMELQ
ncbi:MAG: hypothetical protein LWX83_17470, partial [Anaerolineae bacterium]|nr:hypothetical protein [Anaerolineae bacterium]